MQTTPVLIAKSSGVYHPQKAVLCVLSAYVTFIGLGMSSGLLGVAWPSVAVTFARSPSALSGLLLGGLCGSLLVSMNIGWLTARFGVGRLLAAGCLLLSVCLLGHSTAGTWWLFVLWSVIEAIAGGMLGAAMNVYAARHFPSRQMTWLHASFGIGMLVGPPMMTFILLQGVSWRWGYGLAGCGLLAIAAWLLRINDWWLPLTPLAEQCSAKPTFRAMVRQPQLWLMLMLFFVYPLESVVDKWGFMLLIQERHVAVEVAGLGLTLYWGMFSFGRFFAGVVVERIGSRRLLRISTVGVVCGALLVGLPLGWAASLVGLGVLGMAMAPLYPLWLAQTPQRLSAALAPLAVGWQISAGTVGAAVLPGVTGLIAERYGLAWIGVVICGLALLIIVWHEVLLRLEYHCRK